MTGPNRGKPRLVADRRYPAKAKAQAKKAPPRKSPARRTKKSRPPRRPGSSNPLVRLFRWILRLFWLVVSRTALALAVVIGIAVFYIYTTLPPYEGLLDGRSRGSVTFLDRDGSVFAWRGEQFGGQITADTVSPNLRNAIIATEDRRFYRHFGVSPRGIASAIRINLSEGRSALSGHGGSTLTQQTAKLLCLGVAYDPKTWKTQSEYEADCRESTIARKAKEAIYAMAMEARYSKDEILSIYMNRAYLGEGANGFEAAAQRYFGKSAAEVNIPEAAMLAGLLTAPSRYAPTNNLQRSQERANVVLMLMNQQGYITDEERADARAHPAELSDSAAQEAGGYFADWVMGSGPDFLTRNTTEDVIIETTFDPRIQKAAEDALVWIFDNKVKEGSKAQAAIIVMSADGAVRGMVGGRKLKVSGAFNRATQAKRQPGSAFKPFVYATALDMGIPYDSVIEDEPITFNIPGSGPYSPQNYDRKFHGMVTLTDALRHSYNIPAVKLAQMVDVENVRTVAQQFGIESDLAQGLALALGVSETTLLELTGAYAGILNGGTSVTPYGLKSLRLKGDQTPLMGQEGGLGERVISPDAAQALIYMMNQVVERGTGTRAKIPGVEVAGKTGTTQAARDAWFMGFTADYVAGVWIGYDDNTPLSGVTGGGLPAEIWQKAMEAVQEGIEPHPLPMIRPATPPQVGGQVYSAGAAPGSGGQPAPAPAPGNDRAENVLSDILGAIFGSGN
ncbi:transglycosylase domain-containing protein [Celeribacter indicus]|uniref:Glycosyl transferase family protein n=1 Tax=Celeribacter indicus TaxID=1208324 RepID=A0A0B5DVT1_9RHOB|nr:PBP1A family penicillin-binding protein [Celeribacter indicus]AJE45280.1 glycosyl transferase family protein [Celeribacter indicus]SDX20884.1 penicillin-binding protein, 1A family [Celeribacter indicus]